MSHTGGPIEIEIDQATREALQTNLTSRFLLITMHTFESRHSAAVIAWAEALVQNLSPAILRAIGLETKSTTHQLNSITMMNELADVYIMYDIFIDGCDEVHKAYVNQTDDKQPIHKIEEGTSAYHVFRAEWKDNQVARDYADRKRFGKGPKPLFVDLMNPPFYDQGVRVEDTSDYSKEQGDGSDKVGEEADIPEADISDGCGDTWTIRGTFNLSQSVLLQWSLEGLSYIAE